LSSAARILDFEKDFAPRRPAISPENLKNSFVNCVEDSA
jgi:hypothetical protein